VLPDEEMLSTQTAADILNVSRHAGRSSALDRFTSPSEDVDDLETKRRSIKLEHPNSQAALNTTTSAFRRR
jgi:hypothetical protein